MSGALPRASFLRFIFHVISLEVDFFDKHQTFLAENQNFMRMAKSVLDWLHTYHISYFTQQFKVLHEKECEMYKHSLRLATHLIFSILCSISREK